MLTALTPGVKDTRRKRERQGPRKSLLRDSEDSGFGD